MRTYDLKRRLRRLEDAAPTAAGDEEVDPQWRSLAARSSEARRRAVAVTRALQLIPPNANTLDTLFADPRTFEDIVWLEATRAGGLGNLLSSALISSR